MRRKAGGNELSDEIGGGGGGGGGAKSWNVGNTLSVDEGEVAQQSSSHVSARVGPRVTVQVKRASSKSQKWMVNDGVKGCE